MKRFKEFLTEKLGELRFDVDSADAWIEEIKRGIKAPYVQMKKSTLGGNERVTIMINLSLDPKEDWSNGIYQNSRFGQLSLSRDGVLKMFTSGYTIKNMRKARVKSAADVVKKINTWIGKVS